MTVKYDASSEPSFFQSKYASEYTHNHPSAASVFELEWKKPRFPPMYTKLKKSLGKSCQGYT